MGLLKTISNSGDVRGRPIKDQHEGMMATEVASLEAKRTPAITALLPGKPVYALARMCCTRPNSFTPRLCSCCAEHEQNAEGSVMEGIVEKHVSIHKKGIATKEWAPRYLTLTSAFYRNSIL